MMRGEKAESFDHGQQENKPSTGKAVSHVASTQVFESGLWEAYEAGIKSYVKW